MNKNNVVLVLRMCQCRVISFTLRRYEALNVPSALSNSKFAGFKIVSLGVGAIEPSMIFSLPMGADSCVTL